MVAEVHILLSFCLNSNPTTSWRCSVLGVMLSLSLPGKIGAWRQGESHGRKGRIITGSMSHGDVLPTEGQCQLHVVLGAPGAKELRWNCNVVRVLHP